MQNGIKNVSWNSKINSLLQIKKKHILSTDKHLKIKEKKLQRQLHQPYIRMRYVFFSILIIISGVCNAQTDKQPHNVGYKLTQLIQMQTQINNSQDLALQVLKDLKQENTESQSVADNLSSFQKKQCTNTIDTYEQIATSNVKNSQEATTQKELLEKEISDASDYLKWIQSRQDTINLKRSQLGEQRCASSSYFILALKEHSEAIQVINALKKDIQPQLNEEENRVGLIQTKSISDKLKGYSHLFDLEAIQTFSNISQAESATDWDFHENNYADEGTAQEDNLIQFLEKLEESLKKSIEDLTQHEIQSAWDLVNWLQQSEKEIIHLDSESQSKSQQLGKLNISLQQAVAFEDQSWRIHSDSISILENYQQSCQAKQEFDELEAERRRKDNLILEDLIQMFTDNVLNMNTDFKNKIDPQNI